MGRNVEQNRQLREVQYARILQTSLNLFVGRGFAATRVADIATDAGVSPGLLYHYFPSKDDILVALLQESLPKLEATALDLEALAMPVADKLLMALQRLIEGIQTRSDTSKHYLLIAQISTSDALPDVAGKILERYAHTPYAVMERLFAEGQREGRVRDGDPRQMAMIFWSLIKGLSIHHAMHGRDLGEPTAEAIAPLFLK